MHSERSLWTWLMPSRPVALSFLGIPCAVAAGGIRTLAIVFCTLWLSACAGLSPVAGGKAAAQRDALQSFFLEGRFSLRHEDKSYAGRLSWRHAGNDDELLLASPLGQGMAEVVSGADGARLTTSDGKSYSAADAETLTLQVLGYPLPLKKLAGWVRARRDGQAGEFDAPDSLGRPLGLRQGEWRINYEYDGDDPQALPARLFVKRADALELRLRIDEWSEVGDASGRKSQP